MVRSRRVDHIEKRRTEREKCSGSSITEQADWSGSEKADSDYIKYNIGSTIMLYYIYGKIECIIIDAGLWMVKMWNDGDGGCGGAVR